MVQAIPFEQKVLQETEGAIVRGEYSTVSGPRKFLNSRGEQEDVDYYSAGEVEELLEAADEELAGSLGERCSVSVCEEDALVAALAIAEKLANADDDAKPVLVLNFACAYEAGGNKLIGKHTLEGELCRRSTLFASLASREARPFYDDNREHSGGIYTNGVLVSPIVEVFRQPNYNTMDAPVVVSAISTPAPFKRGLESWSEDELFCLLKTRIQGVLAVAAQDGYKHLVLGAWGCGSNCNDPVQVARAFRAALDEPLADAAYANLFDTVTFAVIDPAQGQPNLIAFQNEFGA